MEKKDQKRSHKKRDQKGSYEQKFKRTPSQRRQKKGEIIKYTEKVTKKQVTKSLKTALPPFCINKKVNKPQIQPTTRVGQTKTTFTQNIVHSYSARHKRAQAKKDGIQTIQPNTRQPLHKGADTQGHGNVLVGLCRQNYIISRQTGNLLHYFEFREIRPLE